MSDTVVVTRSALPRGIRLSPVRHTTHPDSPYARGFRAYAERNGHAHLADRLLLLFDHFIGSWVMALRDEQDPSFYRGLEAWTAHPDRPLTNRGFPPRFDALLRTLEPAHEGYSRARKSFLDEESRVRSREQARRDALAEEVTYWRRRGVEEHARGLESGMVPFDYGENDDDLADAFLKSQTLGRRISYAGQKIRS